jgi:hypothetical protein
MEPFRIEILVLVSFIPSGLGYFSQGQNSIPAYAPLIFSIKLYEINIDSDVCDGIFSRRFK